MVCQHFGTKGGGWTRAGEGPANYTQMASMCDHGAALEQAASLALGPRPRCLGPQQRRSQLMTRQQRRRDSDARRSSAGGQRASPLPSSRLRLRPPPHGRLDAAPGILRLDPQLAERQAVGRQRGGGRHKLPRQCLCIGVLHPQRLVSRTVSTSRRGKHAASARMAGAAASCSSCSWSSIRVRDRSWLPAAAPTAASSS